jgi:hypothetical protein
VYAFHLDRYLLYPISTASFSVNLLLSSGWDIDKGPVKYYENKGNHLLAIYRVYNIDYVIGRRDVVPDKNGNLPSFNKKLLH